jgi:hypothetical protein
MNVVPLEEHNFDVILIKKYSDSHVRILNKLSYNYIEQTTTTVDVLKTEKGYSYEKMENIQKYKSCTSIIHK